MNMKADYKNWVPKGMIYGLMAGTIQALPREMPHTLTLRMRHSMP